MPTLIFPNHTISPVTFGAFTRANAHVKRHINKSLCVCYPSEVPRRVL
jgi:hypothetical protein